MLYLEVLMARYDKQVNVRMAHETIDEIKEEAKKNRQSFTAQLNDIAEEWLKQKQIESAKA